MPSAVTNIANSRRWEDQYVHLVGESHVTVMSRARIDARIDHGVVTITTMPAPAVRPARRPRPLADGVPADGGVAPSDGPPSWRQSIQD